MMKLDPAFAHTATIHVSSRVPVMRVVSCGDDSFQFTTP
jgi:hypothetical protein